jgi:hypothetical protein
MKSRILKKVEWLSADDNAAADVSFLPMMVRRRLSPVERAALHVSWKVFSETENDSSSPVRIEKATVPVVFASRWGEIGTTLKLMQQMHSEGEMSPAGFSSSVHNAAPGVWSLFTGNTAPYTAIAAREHTYDAGLMEAEAQLKCSGAEAVLYVYAEEATPDYYKPAFKDVERARAVAMLIVSDEE